MDPIVDEGPVMGEGAPRGTGEGTSRGAIALVGPGRAGMAVAVALRARGRRVVAVAGRAPDAPSTRAGADRLGARIADVADVGAAADLLVLATPDAAVPDVAALAVAALPPGALVVHLAGSLGVGAFDAAAARRADVRFGALHPLVSLPSAELGAARLAGAWCAIAGDPDVIELATELGMSPFAVDDATRPAYHAAAAVAANHLVALLGQVERLARATGVPFEAFLPLVRSAVDNVAALGPLAALTGPVARGDVGTVAAHLRALPADERCGYRALAAEALRLAGRADGELEELLA